MIVPRGNWSPESQSLLLSLVARLLFRHSPKLKWLLKSNNKVRKHTQRFLLSLIRREDAFIALPCQPSQSIPPKRQETSASIQHVPSPTRSLQWDDLVKVWSTVVNGFPFFTPLKEKKKVHKALPKLICMAFSCSYLHLLTGIKASTFLLEKSFSG